jgi:peroxiredoxin
MRSGLREIEMNRYACFCLALLWLLYAAAGVAGQSLTRLPGGVMAPDFTLPDTHGKLHRLSEYRGRPVIVNFWATWCPPCREEIPSMNRAWRELSTEGVVMLAVNVGEDADTVFVFTADYPAEFPLLLDVSGEVTGQWPVNGLPTSYVIAPDGTLAYRAIGGRAWDDAELLTIIRSLKK